MIRTDFPVAHGVRIGTLRKEKANSKEKPFELDRREKQSPVSYFLSSVCVT